MRTYVTRIMSERGVAAVELALVSPLLVLLLFTIIEFSLVLFDKAVITNASREGARFGSVHDENGPVDNAEITDVMDVYLNNHLISLGGTNTPEYDPPPTVDGNGFLTVTVNYTYDFLVLPDIASINMSAVTVMKME